MPVEAGNAIYSYITSGRPKIGTEYIFIRSKAPYGKLTGKVCTKALYRILPERKDVKGGGFHVTRRTFATNLLRNHAGIDEVMDALGHRDTTLKINIELNKAFVEEDLDTSIWSFPMKYMPFTGEHRTDRKFIGEHWNAKTLRGVQCILNATHAVVGPKEEFFNHAFGENYEEFEELIYMPEMYITRRKENAENIQKWKDKYRNLNENEKRDFIQLVRDNSFPPMEIENVNISFLYDCYSE